MARWAGRVNVLCCYVGPGIVAVHLPPRGFVPPAPETWDDIADLTAACGFPMGAVAGYGPLDVLQLAEGTDGLALAYCMLCFPLGPSA